MNNEQRTERNPKNENNQKKKTSNPINDEQRKYRRN